MMRFLALGLLTLTAASAAECCTIPVFRFALDRWEADKFHLVLPASASQDTAVQDLLRPLRANGKANLDITTSRDPAQTQAELGHPRQAGRPVWSGKLDKAALDALLTSPVRQQIVDHILAGDSILWIIADSGSPLDIAEAERIEKRLKFLEQVAALPIQDPNDPDSQLGPGPPLRLKFTTLRLRRDDPAEQVLLQMLAGPKGEIAPATTSFATVIFGKGRVLGAWPIAQLDDRSLEETSLFLVGRCSCRLKNENPGWDLLLNVDWEKALQQAGDQKKMGDGMHLSDGIQSDPPPAQGQPAEMSPGTTTPTPIGPGSSPSTPATLAPTPAAVEVVTINPEPSRAVPPPHQQNTPWLVIGAVVVVGLAWWGFMLRK